MKWLEEPNWAKLVAAEKLAAIGLTRAPQAAGAWKALIVNQKRLGKTVEAEASIAKASAAITDRKAFVLMLLEVEEYAKALAEGETLPPDDDIRAMMRKAAIRSNRFGAAERRVLAEGDRTANQAWVATDRDGDLRRLVARYRAMLAENPVHTDARCLLAHALAKLGEADEARATMALDRFLKVEPLAGDSAEIRAALAAEIRRNPTLIADPRNKATRDGQQTSRLGLPSEPAMLGLIARIKTAVERYRMAMDGASDPFIAQAPETVRLYIWAVIYGATGRQTAHRHPGGWLSGVYYVTAPRSDDGYRGALLVGEPDALLRAPPPWGVTRVEPVPGRLVLFPSFVTHATEPCGAGGERISVAFDVIPADEKL